MKKLSLLLNFVMAFSLGASFLSSSNSLAANKIEVHGHRGARGKRPENTIPAFEYAIDHGADVLEMDIAVTKDLKLVISHDPHISSVICLDPQGKHFSVDQEPLIHSLTLKEVQSYDCGTIKNPRFPLQVPVPGTHRPTLDEVFQMVQNSKNPRAKKIKFNIETKIFADHPEYTVDPHQFTQLLLAKINQYGMLSRTYFQSFDYRTLAEARKMEPSTTLVALVEDPKADLVKIAEETHAQVMSPEYVLLNADLVHALHAKNVKVIPWTPDTPEDWSKLIKMKVDGIITDIPDDLVQYLKDNK